MRELKVGDILVTQVGDYLSYAVITKENKITYTIQFLSTGGTETINKKSLTTYCGSYYSTRKYVPFEGTLEPSTIKLMNEKDKLVSKLDECKEELFASKCLLRRLLDGVCAMTDTEQKVLDEVNNNPTEFYNNDYCSCDEYDDYDEDDDWDYGPDPEDDDEPCESEQENSEEWKDFIND